MRSFTVAVVMTVVTGACTKAEDQSANGDSSRAPAAGTPAVGAMPGMGDTSAMKGMDGMKGMEGMGDSTMGGMSGEMHAHMLRMTSASGDGMKGMLPKHRQLVANMIAKMNGEMRDMKMSGDTEWSATVDSLRKDLVRLPALSSTELTATMPAHMARVTHLGTMHQQMMRSMGHE